MNRLIPREREGWDQLCVGHGKNEGEIKAGLSAVPSCLCVWHSCCWGMDPGGQTQGTAWCSLCLRIAIQIPDTRDVTAGRETTASGQEAEQERGQQPLPQKAP